LGFTMKIMKDMKTDGKGEPFMEKLEAGMTK
jgi:hypothetical protein